MRKFSETIHHLRWGPLDERRQRGLIHLHDVLSGTPFHGKYWLTLGLLLGCIREGGPIAWDRDADFGFLERDLGDFHAAVRVLQKHGFSLRPQQINNDGSVTKWALKYQGVKYEFFMFREHQGRLRWYYHSRKPPMEVVNEVAAHGLDELELYGRRWLRPADSDAYLGAIYGDWRTPNSNYRYWRDCQATVERHPWQVRRARRMR